MVKKNSAQSRSSEHGQDEVSPLQRRESDERSVDMEPVLHALGHGIVCDTDRRGHAVPQGASPERIVVEASEGFIPLWARNTTLRWRFRARSFEYFANPTAAKDEIRRLFAAAVMAWGSAAPITFTEDEDVWDFEIVMRSADDCNPGGGCVLASAFFPDSGRHQLQMYPRLFTQARKEQVDTFIHEIGHVFGLRHFFANISETAWPSEIFGTHSKFSIMNYGALSDLTSTDKDDLRRLYQLAWAGWLTQINGTPIRFVRPYHMLAYVPDSMAPSGSVVTPFLPRPLAPDGPTAAGEILGLSALRSRAAYLGGV